jgi:predicted MPP superfamily phosphohydrolase
MTNVIFEDLACLLFLCAVGAVYAGCVLVIKRIKICGWKTYKYRFSDILILGLGLVGLGFMSYGVLVEPFDLQVTQVAIQSDKLPINQRPLRLVLISDIHSDGIVRTEKKLPAVIASVHPDVILFAGDAANNAVGVNDFRQCMIQLTKIAPVVAVYGNHDAHIGARWNIYGNTGVTWLQCNSKTLKIRDQSVWIGGVGIDNEKLMEQTLNAAPARDFSVFLYHYPVGVKYAAAHQIDLFCGGHTHGGQICLPVYGAIVTQSVLGKEFESGLHHVQKTWCYINRGIGMTSIPARFLCKPEVTVIDITGSGSTETSAPSAGH